MTEFELVRVAVEDDGAFGVLKQDGYPFAVTVERTGPDNHVKIPAGEYVCKRTVFYKRGYETYEVTGVEGHSRLLFHVGNGEQDSEGCVLVGLGYGPYKGKPGILRSRPGFAEFMRRAAGRKNLLLTVTARVT